ncbi:hypothetical protein PpBr36_07242 [Pyricularia pennisetigena]|uniref:hypothetical protein n=1 Tax=Pyricularia pennisetigena TaxID=1578925 RepID=UPI00115149A6|nr:hypothetical protein PpBr36_07242 [Pyricularia pennisetigena]TLS25234.1 hypothetical protein PpBr36_07242 [Pyricularia pennisetigena]
MWSSTMIATPQSQGHGRPTLHYTATMSNAAAGRDHSLPGGLKCSSDSQKSSPKSLFFPSPTTAGQAAAAAAAAADSQRKVLLFFIPGNPGLVEYYGPFLSHLRRLLNESGSAAVAVDLYGTSLSGFDDADHEAPFRMPGNPPRDVADQIQFVEDRLAKVCAAAVATRPYDAVVVMGHSVGAYIACEVVHRGKQRRQQQPALNTNGAARTGVNGSFRAGILLFPTIAHIALSPSGRRLDRIRRVGLLDAYAHVAAALLLSVLPLALLRFVLRTVWKMPPHAVDTTTAWLGSRDGVWQALHMGKDEMRVIGEDRWGDDFWEEVGGGDAAAAAAAAKPGDAGTRFFLLYGKNDHWVAEDVRDAFLAKREARKGLRTKVAVDDTGVLPHDFCINYSEPVAEKVMVWLAEALEDL